jgi:integrase/recombinase XerD
MALQLYRRHTSKCIAKRPRWDRSYRRCKCPIHAEGTLRIDGFIRRGTSETDWDRAEQVRRKWEAAGTLEYDATGFGGAPSLAEPEAESRISIVAAVRAYLSDAQARNLSEATLYKLKIIFEKQFFSWCAHKGYRFLIQVDLDSLREFRETWKDAPLARSKKQARLIGFFYFCVRSGWLIQNPALLLGKIKVVQKPTGYFEPQQYSAVIDATYCYRDTRFEQGDGIQVGGARIRTLTELMRWTGLRIRDAVTLERIRLSQDPLDGTERIMLYQAKTGEPVYCPIPPHLAELLRSVPPGPLPNPKYFFWSGNGLPKSAVANWQRSYRKLFAIADLREPDGQPKRSHPHIFRDTFAVESLVAGMRVEEVSMLLGHRSVRVTEKHYLPWVRARQTNLTESAKMAWVKQGIIKPATSGKRPRKAQSAFMGAAASNSTFITH